MMLVAAFWLMPRPRRCGRAHLAVLNGLGPSLADVAAFMHEIELRQALPLHKQDERLGSIERLRQLALKMQSLQLWYERKQTVRFWLAMRTLCAGD